MTVENIIPNHFERQQKKELDDILSQYIYCTPYFQDWYNDYATKYPLEKAYFDTKSVGDLRVRMPHVDLQTIDIHQHSVIYTLVNRYEVNLYDEIKITDSDADTINKLLIENPFGHLIVVSSSNHVQNVAKIELAKTYRLPFDYDNIAHVKPTYDIDDSFKLYEFQKKHL